MYNGCPLDFLIQISSCHDLPSALWSETVSLTLSYIFFPFQELIINLCLIGGLVKCRGVTHIGDVSFLSQCKNFKILLDIFNFAIMVVQFLS